MSSGPGTRLGPSTEGHDADLPVTRLQHLAPLGLGTTDRPASSQGELDQLRRPRISKRPIVDRAVFVSRRGVFRQFLEARHRRLLTQRAARLLVGVHTHAQQRGPSAIAKDKR